MSTPEDSPDIAIIGLACNFPGASNADEFWQNLANGVESIARLTDEEMLEAGVPPAHLAAPNYVKASPVLAEPGGFDAPFFGFTPGEARLMDPQHRLLLELAHTALEDAGCNPAQFPGRIGVYAGSAMNTYFMHAGLSRNFAEDYIPTLIVNDKDFLSTRVSYKLNLKGPSVTLQTACSTSLVAVHFARQSLLLEETNIALAGAISVRAPHRAGYLADAGGVTSPDGHVRAFDAAANGTVFGSGGGVIVLKRLQDALAAGDTIRAIIRGSAINNDGAEKAGYTAPSVNSQADAVIEALANADADAESISYIETHGSGTPVGDPIEIRALTKAFRASTARSGFCAIGSVKTNVGHLDAAAGMAGLIKTVLALQHRQIPASLHYRQPNPEIDFASTPFFVNTQLTPWRSDGPRRAGLMATGMGGTNAHVVLEEAPAATASSTLAKANLLLLSARTETALTASADRLRTFLEENPTTNLRDAAFTLQTGRQPMEHRRFVVATDPAGAVASLTAKAPRLTTAQVEDRAQRPVILLLPGVGDHYVGMGRELYLTFPAFRREVDRCAEILRPHLGLDIRDVLYPKNRDWKKGTSSTGIDLKKMLAGNAQPAEDDDTRRLNQAVHVQPALFTVEYALARLWSDLGIEPQAIVGHSMGEYVAACLAGVFSLEDALRLIVRRTQLVDQLPPARMLAVTLSEAELAPLLPSGLSIALINGASLCIVAGAPDVAEDFSQTLTTRGVNFRSVQNTHAFHSRLLDPIIGPFEAEARKVRFSAPKIPFISNVTGRWITNAEATDPAYWAKHLNHTARFSDGLATLWQTERPLLLEAGPGKTLGVLAMQHPAKPSSEALLPISSLRHHYEGQADEQALLTACGRLWLTGRDLRWEKLPSQNSPRRIPLPTYPFERQTFWLKATPGLPLPTTTAIGKNQQLREWFYVPSWQRQWAMPAGAHDLIKQFGSERTWLFFLDECGVASEVVKHFREAGITIFTVRSGSDFIMQGPREFSISPGNAEHYERLLQSLSDSDRLIGGIIHAWTLSAAKATTFDRAQNLGFYSLSFLAAALTKHHVSGDLKLFALSNYVHDVLGRETLAPEKATVLGPCLVIPQEFPNIVVKNIDLELPAAGVLAPSAVKQLLGEICRTDAELFVAYRNGQRWSQTYEPITLPEPATTGSIFRESGVYLITGGLGNVGRTIASHLAKNYRAKLILLGRSPLPARESWADYCAAHPEDDPQCQKIRQIADIEKLGGQVRYFAAGFDDAKLLQSELDEAERQFGKLHGVIHGAGVVGDRGYAELGVADRSVAEAHFQSKVGGLHALENLLADRTLDFCLLLSSLASILGGVGQAAYAAVNIYLDAFAQRASGLPWLSVNWDVWRVQENVWGAPGIGRTLDELGMTGDEAMQAMELALQAKGCRQLAVSTGSLDVRIRQWVKLESLRKTPSSLPEEKADLALPGDEIEQGVGRVWRDVLGMDGLALDDSFFDLGGHSLLALQIVTRIRAAYGVEIALREFFEMPTIAKFSTLIRDKLIAEIENMTDEQVRELIENN